MTLQLPLLVRQRRPLHGVIPASEHSLVLSATRCCQRVLLFEGASRKAQEHTRSWLGCCVYFQGSGRLHGLFPSSTSTAVGRCPLQPTHARDRQPERRWQALLLAALDIFLEPWSKVGQASPQWLPQWLPVTSPPCSSHCPQELQPLAPGLSLNSGSGSDPICILRPKACPLRRTCFSGSPLFLCSSMIPLSLIRQLDSLPFPIPGYLRDHDKQSPLHTARKLPITGGFRDSTKLGI